jgi:hypothetical protein
MRTYKKGINERTISAVATDIACIDAALHTEDVTVKHLLVNNLIIRAINYAYNTTFCNK